MSVTLDTVATVDLIRDLAAVVAVKPDGTRWKACSVTQMQRTCQKFLAGTVDRNDGADVTLRKLLTADAVAAYCDGTGAVNTASIPPLAKHVQRMLLHLEPDADTQALTVLIAHAEATNKERAAAANGRTPPYSLFRDAAHEMAQCLYSGFTL